MEDAARSVRIGGREAVRRRRHVNAYRRFGAIAVAVSAGAAGCFAAIGAGWLWAYLAGVNLCAFVLYACDKSAARRGALRVPELVLHALALAGGTPAAWLAQRAFRHKTVKGRFRAVFWAVVVVQAAAIGLWVYLSWSGG